MITDLLLHMLLLTLALNTEPLALWRPDECVLMIMIRQKSPSLKRSAGLNGKGENLWRR